MKAKVLINDIEYEVKMDSNETILESCLIAQVGPSYSCLEGVCSTCEVEVIDGEVRVGNGFETDEHPRIVKSCQSFPVSKTVKLKYLKKT